MIYPLLPPKAGIMFLPFSPLLLSFEIDPLNFPAVSHLTEEGVWNLVIEVKRFVRKIPSLFPINAVFSFRPQSLRRLLGFPDRERASLF